ncbi:MAG: AAA family ATPase [Planctomycetaceae bacterium]|nr:AAA family ATPase [Planctomycetaceae bacterium]
MPYPSIHVKNFARIKEAEVELAPLTLFAGDNNSGKSYLSSLIWVFYQRYLPFRLFEVGYNTDQTDIIPDDTILRWIKKGFREGLHDDVIQVSEKTHNVFQTTINALLNRHKERLVRFVFCRKIDIDHLSLKLTYNPDLQFQMSVRPDTRLFYDENEDQRQIQFTIGRSIWRKSIRNPKDPHLLQKLYCTLLETYFLSCFWGTCKFFPASRTGFLLTYKSVIDKALKRDLGPRLKYENRENRLLTTPQSIFLRSLARSPDRIRRIKSGKSQSLI